ncbi:MAG: hypothetical protein LUB59_00840 [Candidatus Gastranaerophilales bacterium]|nr:hypothetical protein [Candidatus Gastranaerophilales bacterium]
MRKLLIILTIFILALSRVYADTALMRDYDGIEVPKGSFIQVLALQDFSTAYSDNTNELKFVCINDVFEFETKIIPKGTVFYGFIEKKNEPVIGTHGSMVVRITKMVFVDGFTIPIRGYIHTKNGNIIGGEMTDPEVYDKVPHYQEKIARHFVGVLQYVPGETRKMGEHVTVAAGANLLIVLTEPAYITHTLTD